MTQLEFVAQDRDNPYVNALLYGGPKTGKTVGAATSPGPVLYVNADSPNATRFAHRADFTSEIKEVKATGLSTLIDVTNELLENVQEYGSVVVDPVGDLYRKVLEDLSGRALSPRLNEYGDTGTHLERFCRALCDLPLNAIFVAHETAVKDEADGGFERLPYMGTNNPAPGAKLMAMVDVIGYTGVKVNEDKSVSYVAQLYNGHGRRGGDRFGVLGKTRDINISEWVDLTRPVIAA